MILVHVWMTLPNGERVHAGKLGCTDADIQGFFRSEFRYTTAWLSHPSSFDLVPRQLAPYGLPLREAPFGARQFEPPLGFVEDALPDSWGRGLLTRALERKNALVKPHQKLGAYLLIELGASAIGALSFAADNAKPLTHEALGSEHLSALVKAAENYELGRLNEGDGLHRLMNAGGTPGGARPKALVYDDQGHWIAKFPSTRDQGQDVVGLEAAGMQTAETAGLRVPRTRLVTVGKKRALMVERFDLTKHGRKHMLSLKTLCAERPGLPAQSYKELAERIRLVSAAPASDVTEFFRHVIYNAAIGNTDDHSKNFWVIREDQGWRLSPSFDLVPNYHRQAYHQLAFQYDQLCPTRSTALEIARLWGIEEHLATQILEQVTEAARQLPSAARTMHVPEDQVAWVEEDIDRRCNKLRTR